MASLEGQITVGLGSRGKLRQLSTAPTRRRRPQAVAALAVGAVGQQVEARDRAQRGVTVGLLEQREVVGLDVEGHEPLQRAHPEGQALVVAQHRLGHDAPPQPRGELVGGRLAAVEPGGEVPQRSLAATGLVDGAQALAAVAQLDQQRGVRAPRHAPEHLDLARTEHVEHGGRVEPGRQFIRGHVCPSASMGRPQKPQSGRPATPIEGEPPKLQPGGA